MIFGFSVGGREGGRGKEGVGGGREGEGEVWRRGVEGRGREGG